MAIKHPHSALSNYPSALFLLVQHVLRWCSWSRLRKQWRADEAWLGSPLLCWASSPSLVLGVIKGSCLLATYWSMCPLGLTESHDCVAFTAFVTLKLQEESRLAGLDGCICRLELEHTFSIWLASRRSLASLRLGLNVSGSNSAFTDVPCWELTSSLVVI